MDPGRLRLGLLVAPGLPPERTVDLTDALPATLDSRFGVAGWDVETVAGEGPDLVAAGRHELVERGWDLAVVLTDRALTERGRPVLAQASALHGVAVLSVPMLGAVQVRRRLRDSVGDLVELLLGGDGVAGGEDDDTEELAARLRELRDDDGVDRDGGAALLTARVLSGNLRLLLGLVRANQPWRLTLRLTRTLSAAAAAGVLALITPDVWVLAAAYGPLRLALLGLASVLATGTSIVVGARLWERTGRRGGRRQVALFNLATALTVLVGVTVLHLVLFVLALLGAFALVVPEVLAATVGREVGLADLVRLAWFTTTLSTVAGALGAGLEDDDTVREATYTHQEAQAPPPG